MNEAALLHNSLILGAVLFGIGMVGMIVRRNMIVMFLCAEMMLQGVSLSLVAFGRYHNDWGGQMLVLFIITVAACEAGIAMALILMLATFVPHGLVGTAAQIAPMDRAYWPTTEWQAAAPERKKLNHSDERRRPGRSGDRCPDYKRRRTCKDLSRDHGRI